MAGHENFTTHYGLERGWIYDWKGNLNFLFFERHQAFVRDEESYEQRDDSGRDGD